jgi:3-dehydroquinate dehydratase II
MSKKASGVIAAKISVPAKPGLAKILVLHGPNLNLLGSREPKIYGRETLADIDRRLIARGRAAGVTVTCFQSNHEGELIDRVQQSRKGQVDFIIINPAGYTHTSVALRDALAAAAVPYIEVHVSNIHAREPFRSHSYFSEMAVGTICGLGSHGYELALQHILQQA